MQKYASFKKNATKKKKNDLRFLKEQEIKGAFACAEDVKRFMDSCYETKEKIYKMHIEVRYAKTS